MESSEDFPSRLRRRGPGLFVRGMCMGTADVIPGVSGGTIALIMGIYDELVSTIAAMDGGVVRALLRGQVGEFLQRVNASFLVPLLAGIGLAILSLAKLITYLLEAHPQPIWGFFTGLIVASALVVGRKVAGWGWRTGVSLVLGVAAGYVITSLVPVQTGVEWYKFFLAGVVGICAMILPGISGSFILLVLGKYQQVFTAIHQRDLQIVALVGAGCAVGLLAFSRVLKKLLAAHHALTMAFLVGLMLGSLRKVWPFRQVLEEAEIGGKMVVLRDQCVWPESFAEEVWLSLGLMLAGAVLVVVLERLGGEGTSP